MRYHANEAGVCHCRSQRIAESFRGILEKSSLLQLVIQTALNEQAELVRGFDSVTKRRLQDLALALHSMFECRTLSIAEFIHLLITAEIIGVVGWSLVLCA